MTTRTFKVVAGTSVAVATNNQSPNILTIEGYCNGVANTQYWIQLHSVAAPVSGTTAPLRSFQVLGTDGFTFDKGFHGLASQNLTNPPTQPGLWVFLSSTDGVFTTSGITADINVDVEEWELELQGTTTVGDLTTNVSTLTVVADGANTTNRLTKLTVTELNGAAGFIQFFAAPLVANVSVSLSAPCQIPLAANATVTLNFGSQGQRFFSQDANGTKHYGIYVGLSLTSGVYDSAGGGAIQAVYK